MMDGGKGVSELGLVSLSTQAVIMVKITQV